MSFFTLFGRSYPNSGSEERPKRYRTAQSWLSWKSYSWGPSSPPLDELVGLCAGRKARYMFERKRTLKLLQSLPNPEPIDEPDHNNQKWADRVGGSIVGEREPPRSVIEPWKEPVFGITFRYRHSPQTPISFTNSTAPLRDSSTAPSSSHFGSRNSSPNPSIKSSPSNPQFTPLAVYQAHSSASNSVSSTTQTAHQKLSSLNISSGHRRVPDNNNLSRPCTIPKKMDPTSTPASLPRLGLTRNGRPVIDLERAVKQIEQAKATKVMPKMNFSEELEELGLPLIAHRDVCAEFKQPPSDTTNASSYVCFPQFSQNWDPPLYHLKTMDPEDSTAKWVREYGLGDKTALRPNMGRIHPLKQAEDQVIAEWYAGSRARALKRQAVKEASNIRAVQTGTVGIPVRRHPANNITFQRDAANQAQVQREGANKAQAQKERIRKVTFQTEPVPVQRAAACKTTSQANPTGIQAAQPEVARQVTFKTEPINIPNQKDTRKVTFQANPVENETQPEAQPVASRRAPFQTQPIDIPPPKDPNRVFHAQRTDLQPPKESRKVTFQAEPTIVFKKGNSQTIESRGAQLTTPDPPPRNVAPSRPAMGKKNITRKDVNNGTNIPIHTTSQGTIANQVHRQRTAAYHQAEMARRANAAYEKAQKAEAHKKAATAESNNPKQSPTLPTKEGQVGGTGGAAHNLVAAANQAEMGHQKTQAATSRPIVPEMERIKTKRASPPIPTRPKGEPKKARKPNSTRLTSQEVSRQLKGARPIPPEGPSHHEAIMYERSLGQYLKTPGGSKKKVQEPIFKTVVAALVGEGEYDKLVQEPLAEERVYEDTFEDTSEDDTGTNCDSEEGTDFSDLQLEPWIVEP